MAKTRKATRSARKHVCPRCKGKADDPPSHLAVLGILARVILQDAVEKERKFRAGPYFTSVKGAKEMTFHDAVVARIHTSVQSLVAGGKWDWS